MNSEIDEHMLNTIKASIKRLKAEEHYPCWQTCVLYLVDPDYHVSITIKLEPKQSQYDIGMEMFHGE